MVSSKLRAGNFYIFRRCLNFSMSMGGRTECEVDWTADESLKQANHKEMDFVLILML